MLNEENNIIMKDAIAKEVPTLQTYFGIRKGFRVVFCLYKIRSLSLYVGLIYRLGCVIGLARLFGVFRGSSFFENPICSTFFPMTIGVMCFFSVIFALSIDFLVVKFGVVVFPLTTFAML